MPIPLKILILDDEDYRHEIFAERFKDHIVTHVRSYKEAVNALNNEKFDLAQLDHDLGDYQKDPITGIRFELTGQDVAKFIVEMPKDKQPNRVVVHSWNPPGARAMHEILFRAGVRVAVQQFSVEE